MRTFLTAEWRDLLMLNYEIDPDILTPYIPRGTELDRWNGTTYISIIGFRFLNTRVRGLRVPGHQSFTEINLRFYVRRRVGDDVRRGVVFLREIVPRRAVAIAIAARLRYGEPYVARPMRHTVTSRAIEYAWRDSGRWNSISGHVNATPAPFPVGSEAEFITEHYWGYTARRSGTVEYHVEHEPWLVADVSDARLDCDVRGVYGIDFVEALSRAPRSAMFANGSAVSVSAGVRVRH